MRYIILAAVLLSAGARAQALEGGGSSCCYGGGHPPPSTGGVESCETIRGEMVCGSEDEIQAYKDIHRAVTGETLEKDLYSPIPPQGTILGTPSTSTYKSTTVPIPSEGTLYINTPRLKYCDPGWTLVSVGGVSISSTVWKCAPVGDLKDPQ